MESPEGLQQWQDKVHGGRPLQITRWGSMHEEKASNGIILRSQTRTLIFDCPIDGPKWVQKLAGDQNKAQQCFTRDVPGIM